MPFPEHKLGHACIPQSSPSHPGAQKHLPPLQRPWPEQEFGHAWIWHWEPVKPLLQTVIEMEVRQSDEPAVFPSIFSRSLWCLRKLTALSLDWARVLVRNGDCLTAAMFRTVTGTRALGRRTVCLITLGTLPPGRADTCWTLMLLLATDAVNAAPTEDIVNNPSQLDCFLFVL